MNGLAKRFLFMILIRIAPGSGEVKGTAVQPAQISEKSRRGLFLLSKGKQ